MSLIFVSLVAGIAMGASGKIPAAWFHYSNKMTTIMLFIMLLALGAQIGIDRELAAKLTLLGGRALLIAALSVAGSIGALWAVARKWNLAGSGHGQDRNSCRQIQANKE
ncbi:lysine exporter lyso [Lucifera butyrica]|uniref:Lysine exporter lyso n=1 Tax=Lucifera butyrica TaxID=1351585 RepID=A0A498R721_9FIRM|nr:LysO family transporter [Lucifera butyrica]VBB05963.1 lysine exporter lyso [Lucifera butyrica]